jgi:hypothetical protein
MILAQHAPGASLHRILGNAVAGRRGADHGTRNNFPPSAVQRVGVQPTLVLKECTKRRCGLSKLVPLRPPWKGSGKTQNVAPFLDKVHDSVTRIEGRPEVGIGRQFAIPNLRRPMDWIAVSQSLSSCRWALSTQKIFHVCGKAKLSGLSDGFGSHRSGRQLFCLCQSLRCPGSPIVIIEIVARQFCHAIVLTVAVAGRCAPSWQHRTSSGRRLPAPHE